MKEKIWSIKEIVTEWLEHEGYDGLCNPNYECGCNLNDLIPCDYEVENCVAGHKELQNDGDWLMFPGKRGENTRRVNDMLICRKCGSKNCYNDYVPGIGYTGLVCLMCGNREIGEGERGFAPATSDGKSALKETGMTAPPAKADGFQKSGE